MIRKDNRSSHEPEEFTVSSVRFLREQDGAPERLLKDRLAECLRNYAGVQRAYLAQMRAGGKVGVVLGVKHDEGRDIELVKQISQVFSAIFDVRQHLDVIFLNDDQEREIAQVCDPFFAASVMRQ